MKRLIIILAIFGSVTSHAQHWQTINYILDSNGVEVAKRLPDSTRWNISDPQKAIQSLYEENQRLKTKYELAVAILKLINPNGSPIDKQKYFLSVKAFNSYQNR